jgi:hypothetical protein
MKKKLIIAGVVLGTALVAAISLAVWKAATITDPYLVKPVTVSPAPEGAKVGHSVNSGTRTLSVISSNRVVVVADPGASFQYEVLWVVEQPRKDGSPALMEYKCQLPQYAAADHINPAGSKLPLKIQKTAGRDRWQ